MVRIVSSKEYRHIHLGDFLHQDVVEVLRHYEPLLHLTNLEQLVLGAGHLPLLLAVDEGDTVWTVSLQTDPYLLVA